MNPRHFRTIVLLDTRIKDISNVSSSRVVNLQPLTADREAVGCIAVAVGLENTLDSGVNCEMLGCDASTDRDVDGDGAAILHSRKRLLMKMLLGVAMGAWMKNRQRSCEKFIIISLSEYFVQ